MFDIIIKGGKLIDGTGSEPRSVDVGVKADSIEAIGDLSEHTALTVIDASSQVVTPGFIDMHSHADQTVLEYPRAESCIAQGITTSVGGNCGFSQAPLRNHWVMCFWEWNWWDEVAPRKYYTEPVGDLKKAKQAALASDGLEIDWSSFGEWLERVERARPGVNVVPLVGHSTIRGAVMGDDYRRHATESEIVQMKRHVAEAMDSGAFGISDGLDYAPNSYCSENESLEVIGEAARRGGLYASHWRRTGLREGFGNPGLADGIRQAIEIARKTGAKLELAHLSLGYLTAPRQTPKISVAAAEETLHILDTALNEGVDLTFDCIPNNSGGVLQAKYLAAMLTPWLREAGSLEQFAKNLAAPDLRREIREFILSGRWYNLNPVTNPGWASGVRVLSSSLAQYEGLTLPEVAQSRGQDALDALMDVVMLDPHTRSGQVAGSDEWKRVFYKHPLAMVGVDVFLLDDTYEVKVPPYFLPHANTYGGMARFLKHYALGLLGLEEGIRRLTSLPAQTLGLKERGVIKEGYKADIVVFSPDAVTDTGDDAEPRRYPKGFSHVIVNGSIALKDGTFVHNRTGQVLRK